MNNYFTIYNKVWLTSSACLALAGMVTPLYAQSDSGSIKKKDTAQEDLGLSVVTGKSEYSDLQTGFNSKLLNSTLDIARSLSVITRKDFEERGAQNVQDTLNYTAGVFAGPFGVDNRLDDSKIRGISPLKFQDGFQSHVGFYNTTRPDIFTLESTEVIKGPSSVLYGQGAIGGILNVNTKLPLDYRRNEINLQYGSFDRRQIGLDLTGPLNEDATFLYRFVTLKRESGTQVDWGQDDAEILMPSITWRPTEGTSLTFLANYQKNDSRATLQFLPTFDPLLAGVAISSNTYIGERNWDKYDSKQTAFSAYFDHKFDDTFSIKANARYINGEADYAYHHPIAPSFAPSIGLPALPTGFVHRFGYISQGSSQIWSANVIGRADFTHRNIEHKAQFGLDFTDATTNDNRPNLVPGFRGFFPTRTVVDLRNPTFSGDPVSPPISNGPEFNLQQIGLFVGDTVSVGNWTVSLGARHDWVEETLEGRATAVKHSELSFDAGVMYKFSNGLRPYYSYSESFESNGVDQNTGVIFDPRSGVQHELGLKYQPNSGNTVLTAALFDIKETNRLVDTINPMPINAKYRGAEFEARHRWHDFYLHGSLTYIDAEQTQAGSTLKVPHVPEKQASLWVTYDPEEGKLADFKTGLGVRYASGTYSSRNNFKTDSFTVVDAMIGYRIGNVDLHLGVQNLFDKEYIAGTSDFPAPGTGFGARRTFTLSASYKF